MTLLSSVRQATSCRRFSTLAPVKPTDSSDQLSALQYGNKYFGSYFLFISTLQVILGPRTLERRIVSVTPALRDAPIHCLVSAKKVNAFILAYDNHQNLFRNISLPTQDGVLHFQGPQFTQLHLTMSKIKLDALIDEWNTKRREEETFLARQFYDIIDNAQKMPNRLQEAEPEKTIDDV